MAKEGDQSRLPGAPGPVNTNAPEEETYQKKKNTASPLTKERRGR